MTVAALAPYRRRAAPASSWYDYFDQHRDLYMAPQAYDWTCSICAATWVLQATGIEPDAARESVAYEMGYPSCVNPSVGLANTQCMLDCFARYGLKAHIEWVDWARALELARTTTGCLNSTSWYHFVGVRGLYGNNTLWVANSAPGYRGIWDQIQYGTFQQWAGSWKFVWLEH